MATLRLGIDATGARRGAREFTTATGQVTRASQSAGQAVRGLVGILAGSFALRAVVSTIGQYEESLVTLGGVARATETQLANLDRTARGLGATTRFSALEVADGLTFLARAGFDAEQAIAAIPSTLNLAQVGLIDLGRAADIASNVVSQFGLEAAQTEQVVDGLVIVSNRANTNILQLSEALKFAGPVAGALGNTVEQTAAALGVLGDRGIQGTLAGTGLRTSLLRLADPTESARDTIEQLGLSLESLSPEVNDIVTIFGRLGAAQASATQLARIFGARTAATAIILSGSIDRVRELEQATKDYAGEAERIARLQDRTLPGTFKSLTSAASELILVIGEGGLGQAFKSTATFATDVVRALAGVQIEGEETSATAEALAFALRAAAASGVALAAVRLGTFFVNLAADLVRAIALQRQFAVALDQTTRVAALQRAIAGLTSPLGLVITAAGLAAATFIDLGSESERLLERLERSGAGVADLAQEIDRLRENRARIAQAEELGDFAEVARLAANDIDILNDSAVKLREQLEELGSGATLDLGDALSLGLQQSELDSLARSARLGLRNAFAAAASDNFISGDEVNEIRRTFGTLFDDQDGFFGADVDDFLSDLRTGASQISGQGIGGAIRREIDPDAILLAFEQRFELARFRVSDAIGLVNDRIRDIGQVAGEAGDEAGAALGEDLQEKLNRLRDAVAGVDLEGQLADPTTVLSDAINEFGAALDESGVKLDATSSAVTTLERALEALSDAEAQLDERRTAGLRSFAELRQGLADEREEVGLTASELSSLRFARELDAIAAQSEITIGEETRRMFIEVRQEVDAYREANEQAAQAAGTFTDALGDVVTGSSSAAEAGRRLFESIQRQILDQVALNPLSTFLTGQIQSGIQGFQGLFGSASQEAAGAVSDAAEAAQDAPLLTAISTASTAETVALQGQTTALTAALTTQTTAITSAIGASATGSAAGGGVGAIVGAGSSGAVAGGIAGASGAGAGVSGFSGGGESPDFSGLAANAVASAQGGGGGPFSSPQNAPGQLGSLGSRTAGNGGRTTINNTTIVTPNADSFRRSGRQEVARVRRTARI